jgi:RNA polymerase sigma-70 factor (ECF subfamily)
MDATGTLVEVLKGEGPRVLATLARTIGDLSVAEDALSEATITALDRWSKTGIPDDPRAWLAVVARRKALDLLRRESARSAKETAAFRWGTEAAPDQIEEAIEAMEPGTSLRDDMLRLIFTCCHPALGREAQVALSLRTLARLEVPAIARAFLVPETTMAKRLVRARSKIATTRIPYAIPSDAELPGRLAAVLAVVYLIATEAHAPDRRGRGGPGRSRGRGDPAGPVAGRPDARRARGAVSACLVAADLGPHLRPHRRRR